MGLRTGRLAPLMSSQRKDWQTPPALFTVLHRQHGFTIDACASAHNAQCERYFSRKQDGLKQSWAKERVYCNPPYGRDIGLWMQKAATEDCFCVCLVPARTDTAWWHRWVMGFASEVALVKGRIRFVGAEAGAPFPSALVTFERPRKPLRLSTWTLAAAPPAA